VRHGIRWAAAEPTQGGAYTWAAHDTAVNALRAMNMNILGVLSNAPGWAVGGNANHLIYPTGNVPSFIAYCSAAAARYKGKVAAWEIWNEPNGSWNGPWTIAQYKDVCLQASSAIRTADPAALVVAPVLAGTFVDVGQTPSNTWSQAFLSDTNIRAAVDVLSIHVYCRPFAPEVGDARGPVPTRLNNSINLKNSLGWTNKQLWSTESGWPTIGDTVPGLVTEAQQSTYTVSLAQMFRDRNMLHFPFQLYGSGNNTNTDEAGGMGFIRTDGTRKPVYNAYRNFALS